MDGPQQVLMYLLRTLAIKMVPIGHTAQVLSLISLDGLAYVQIGMYTDCNSLEGTIKTIYIPPDWYISSKCKKVVGRIDNATTGNRHSSKYYSGNGNFIMPQFIVLT